MNEGQPDRLSRHIAVATTILFLLITITAKGPPTYKFAILFLAPILWGVYYFRTTLALHPFYFLLFALALLLHNLGAYGFYRRHFLGLEFDAYVHFYFGLAGGCLVARALEANFSLHGWRLLVGTALVILGIGAIHELIEYASTLILGPEKGMLKTNDGDPFDTQKDLFNNLLGTLVGVALYSFLDGYRAREGKKT